MTSRKLSRALAGASAIAVAALAAAPASAQRIDNIVSFGDSFADTGNAVAIIVANPATPPATRAQTLALYPTGRFSGGTNYIDTLAQILDATVENYAVGGALTGSTNTVAGLPGLTQETAIFLSGTVPAGTFFPVSDGTFDEGDLLAISVGGNDARIFQTGGGTVAGAPAAAATAVTNATNNLNLLVGAGAETISFLAVNSAVAPEVAASPSAQAVRNAFTASFTAGMQSTLAGYAADGVIVHYLDGGQLASQVIANPSLYGLTGLACPVAPNPTCIANPDAAFLFYADALHLTSAGFAILAQYVATQLDAPLTLSAPSELGLNTAQQFGRTLTARMDLGAPRDGDLAQGLKFFAVGDAFMRDVIGTESNHEFSQNTAGGTLGLQYGFGNGIAGLAVNYSKLDAEFGNNAAGVDGNSLQIGGFAGMAVGPIFGQGYIGYGKDDYDITRTGVIDAMSADPDGSHWLAGAKAGFLTLVGPVRVGPVVALDYAKAEVDGYTEEGDPVLTLNVEDVDYDSLRGGVGAEVRGDFAPGGIQVRPYAALMLEKELSGGDRTVHFAQTSAPGIVNHFDLVRTSRDAYGRFTGGGSALINSGVSLDAAISMTFEKEQGNEMSGHLAVKVGF